MLLSILQQNFSIKASGLKKIRKQEAEREEGCRRLHFKLGLGCSHTLKPTRDLPNRLLNKGLKREPCFNLTKLACAGRFLFLAS